MFKWNRLSTGDKVFNVFNITGFLLFSLFCLYPFYYIIILSFNDGIDAMKGDLFFWPRVFSLQNYTAVFNDERILNSALISIFRTVIVVCGATFFNAMFAYALSKRRLPGRKFFNWYILVPMYFTGGIIPLFLLLRQLGLINNILVFILPFLVESFHIILMRSYYAGIPDSLEESAKIDGAGDFRIFFQIYLPLSTPILATIALLTGVAIWNEWFIGTVYVYTDKLWPLQTLLLNIIQGADLSNLMRMQAMMGMAGGVQPLVTVESLKMAVLVVTVAPILFIYPFFQRYFIKGIMLGSVKG